MRRLITLTLTFAGIMALALGASNLGQWGWYAQLLAFFGSFFIGLGQLIR